MNTQDKSAKEEAVNENQNKYEIMLIFPPDLADTQLGKELKTIKSYISDHKGSIYHEDDWGVRDLAYQIKKQNQGYYVIYYFELDAKDIDELEKALLLNQQVLRHLIVRSPKNYKIKKQADFMISEEEENEKRPKRPGKFAAPKAAAVKEKTVKEVEEKVEVPPIEEEKPEKEVEEKPAAKPEEMAAVKSEEKAEEKPEPKKPEPKKLDISELDSKLEKILDDPDINLS